jgi:hypothetical protein
MAEKKNRTTIPRDVAAQVQFLSDRTCCVCHEPGKPIQLHHIDENPSNHDPDNLAVMCLACHDLTQIRGGFGRKLDAAQVRLYRDDWYRTVAKRRETEPSMSAQSQAEGPPQTADSASTPSLSALRDLLLTAFTADDLRRLFLYTSNSDLKPLIQRFSKSDGLVDMVEKTIEYCGPRNLIPNLLDEVKAANPRRYAQWESQHHAANSQTALATPPASSD